MNRKARVFPHFPIYLQQDETVSEKTRLMIVFFVMIVSYKVIQEETRTFQVKALVTLPCKHILHTIVHIKIRPRPLWRRVLNI